ncbi:MAG: hypothetical protein MHPSP_003304, partial [Paramarteilia canceri]
MGGAPLFVFDRPEIEVVSQILKQKIDFCDNAKLKTNMSFDAINDDNMKIQLDLSVDFACKMVNDRISVDDIEISKFSPFLDLDDEILRNHIIKLSQRESCRHSLFQLIMRIRRFVAFEYSRYVEKRMDDSRIAQHLEEERLR